MPAKSDVKSISDLPPADGEFEELAIAEEEFLDAYIRNELAAEERILFEKALRDSSRLRDRLHFARLLVKEVSTVPQPLAAAPRPSPDRSQVESRSLRKWTDFLTPSFVSQLAFRFALAAGVLVLLLGGGGLLAGWLKLRSESQQRAAERALLEQQRQALENKTAEQQSRSAQQTAELIREKQQLEQERKQIEELRGAQIAGAQMPAATVATLFLAPDLTRGSGGPAELSIAPGTSKIKLELGLESVDYSKYRAVIQNAQSIPVYRQSLRPRRSSKALVLLVPASSLPPGYYAIALSGIASSGSAEIAGEYLFSVSRK